MSENPEQDWQPPEERDEDSLADELADEAAEALVRFVRPILRRSARAAVTKLEWLRNKIVG